jgi:hypothetical protein
MGINPSLLQNMQSAGLAGIDRLAGNAMFPQSQMDKTQYAVSSQMPTSADVMNSDYDTKTDSYTGEPLQAFNGGGITALRFNGEDQSAVQDTQPPSMADLASQLTQAYRSNQNYDQLWKDFAATKEQDPKEWYRNQLSFLGNQVGWQIGQNTSGNIKNIQPQIQDTVAQAKAAGLSDQEINSILSNSSQSANQANQQRIANLEEAGGSGFNFQKDLLPGLEKVGLAAAAMTGIGALGAGAAAGEGAGAAAEGAGVGAGEAAGAQGLPSLSDAYNAYKYANMGRSALNMLGGNLGGSGSASSQGGGEDYGINPTASTGINPSTSTGLGGLPATYNPALNKAYGVTGYGGAATSPDYLKDIALQPNLVDLTQLSSGKFAAGGLASGGISTLGSYSDGGRLLKGPGDGMSDHIPAKIGKHQPARLADGEFVVPADVVSHLGNGSTDAGARVLYKMMDKIRMARTGNPKQGKQINPSKFIPKG